MGLRQEEFVWACDCVECLLYNAVEGEPHVWRRKKKEGVESGKVPDGNFWKHMVACGKANARM